LPLGAELGAALTATGSQDGSAGASAHACSEAVVLRTATVVGLESALGHFVTPENYGQCPRQPQQFTLSDRVSQDEKSAVEDRLFPAWFGRHADPT